MFVKQRKIIKLLYNKMLGDFKMVSEFEIKKQICDIGKRIYNRNMVAANDGNISVKISDN